MKAPPSQVLILSTHDSTVFLGPPGAWGMDELGSLTVLDKPVEDYRDQDALRVLNTLKSDSWQVTKLRNYLDGPGVGAQLSLTVTYDARAGRRGTEHVFGTLRTHLRHRRLRAVVIRNHHGHAMAPAARHGAASQVTTGAPLPPLSPGLMATRGTRTQTPPAAQVGAFRAPANIADWSTTRRLDALLEDTLPLLGQDLKAHLDTLMTSESLIRLTAGFALMAGLQAIPGLGEAMDAVFLGIAYWHAGWDGLRGVALLARAIVRAAKAQHEADIAGAAPDAAQALNLLGSAFLDAVILRMAKRSTSGGGSAGGAEAESEAAEAGASRGQGVGGRPAASGTGAATAGGDTEATSAAGGSTAESPATAEQVGHPVNPATGVVFTSQIDFTLPGLLPLVFGRIWMSCSTLNGDLGHGWHHTLDMALLPRPDGRHALRLADGRFVVLDTPAPGAMSHDAVERIQLCWQDGNLVAVDYAGTRFAFGPLLGQPQLRRLVSISDPNTNAITLTRDTRGGLLGIRDSAGRELAVRRDGFGRILGIDTPHPDGEGLLTLAAFEYDRHGDLIASTDAAGASFRYGYERRLLVEEQRPAGLTFRFRYDNTAYRTRARCVYTTGDHGLYERELAYDDAARTTTVRSGRGATWRYEWNEQGRVTAITDPLGRRSTRRYAPDGMLLVGETRADGSAREVARDGHGRIVETRDFDGARRTARYPGPDREGLVAAFPVEVTGVDGATECFDWDDRLNLLAHTDAAGHTRRFLRDPRGLTLAVQDALGPVRRFGWTERGEPAWEAVGDGKARVFFSFDALGRLFEHRRAGEAPTRYQSDPAGRVIEIRRADGGVIRLTRDLEGHVISHQDASGGVTRWSYGGGLPVPTGRTNPDGSSLSYHYDADLNLVGLINAKGERYRLGYDLADQLVEEVGFDGRRRGYRYDVSGYLASHDDAEERGASYRRDPMGRLLERRHSDGLVDRYTFNPGGRMTLAANDWGEIAFSYGPNGMLEEEAGPTGKIRHRHDARGRRVATVLPDGRSIGIGLDARNDVSRIDFDGRLVASFGRDALGREIERSTGALLTWSEYDPQGRLSRQAARHDNGVDEPLIERRYRWDESDRLAEVLDLGDGLRRYRYDACHHLVGMEGDRPERFVVDPAGNILGGSGDVDPSAAGVATGDRLLLRGDAKFEYDGCGNRVREVRGAGGNVERLYRYRADNQLAELEERSRLGRRVTAFAYDALGRRTVKRSQAWGPPAANDGAGAYPVETHTNFVWSGNVLLAEGSSDALATVYLHEPGSFRPLAQVRREGVDGTSALFHYHLDHLGTPQEVTNDDGRIVWQARLKVWGALARVAAAEVAQPIRFQGQYHDVETGLHYNRFRYYAPGEGCYVQQDPIGILGGTNMSAYVSAPTAWIDPFGLAGCAAEQPRDPATGKWTGAGSKPGGAWEDQVTSQLQAVPGNTVYTQVYAKAPGMDTPSVLDDVVVDQNGNMGIVEAKSGSSSLTSNQAAIQDAVQNGQPITLYGNSASQIPSLPADGQVIFPKNGYSIMRPSDPGTGP